MRLSAPASNRRDVNYATTPVLRVFYLPARQQTRSTHMNLNISGHHIDMTQALHDYVASKMDRIERHFGHLIDAQVVLEVEKLRHKAEVTMSVRGNTLHAEATDKDMYTAINLMVDKLDRQARRHKDKAETQRNRKAANVSSGAG